MEQLCWKCRAPATVPASRGLPKVSSRDLTHLLNSNEDRMAALDAQIDSLQAVLAQLTRTRDESAERVRQHHAILSPIRSVPTELICEILALVWLSGENNNDDMKTMPRAPPWHFGLISRAWRHAALSYIPFWCSITIPSSPTLETRHLLETQLLRSSKAPLRIYWQAKELVDPDLLEPVVAQCRRWSALHMDCQLLPGAADSLLDWLHPAVGRLAQLQKLSVVTADNALRVWDMFLTTLSLREVILTDPELNMPSPLFIGIPWAQLTHYRGVYDIHRQSEILSAAFHLVECAVGLTGFGSSTGNPHDVTILPNLRRLCIKGPPILNRLNAPLLHTLYSLRDAHLRTILPFVQRSACTLTKLVLLQCKISDKLIEVLRGLPTLAYLFIDSQSYDSLRPQITLFNAMTRSGASSDLCPNLTSLLYAYERTIDDDEEDLDSPIEKDLDFPRDHFFNMVQSRLKPERTCYLEFLRIFYTPGAHLPPPTDIVARLKTLQDVQDGRFDATLLDYRDLQALRARGDFF
ncbi:hypothetical protein B0H19DRAFT_295740 [Mycena capillaripes]|nr:hypothetical protein B0H19DRAFT_295740 [Mycena capillaripes]